MSLNLHILLGSTAKEALLKNVWQYHTIDILAIDHEDKISALSLNGYKSASIDIHGSYARSQLQMIIKRLFDDGHKMVIVDDCATFINQDLESNSVIGLDAKWFWGFNDVHQENALSCAHFINDFYNFVDSKNLKTHHDVYKAIIEFKSQFNQ